MPRYQIVAALVQPRAVPRQPLAQVAVAMLDPGERWVLADLVWRVPGQGSLTGRPVSDRRPLQPASPARLDRSDHPRGLAVTWSGSTGEIDRPADRERVTQRGRKLRKRGVRRRPGRVERLAEEAAGCCRQYHVEDLFIAEPVVA